MDCSWPVDRTGCWQPLPPLPDDPTDEQVDERLVLAAKRDAAEKMAIDVLWALSGRQFGCTDVTARPCPAFQDYYAQRLRYLSYMPVLEYGDWMDVGCGCMGSCTVTGPRVVHLPGPVAAIIEVTVSGVVLADDDYSLEGDALYRASGASWPQQNLGAPLGEAGTWSVRYQQGIPAPVGVGTLTAALAHELLASCTEDMECRIPRTVTGSSRRGVSYEFDPSKLLAAGKTGLPEVDMWLASVNPHQLAAAPEVF